MFIGNRWEGLIGFADAGVAREWTDDDLIPLTTAAHMISAFWEREESRAKLREAVLAKDTLVAIVSHELRNALTAVLGLAAVLADRNEDFTPDEAREYASIIQAESQEMAFLIEDLLVAAQADLGRVNITPATLDLKQETLSVLGQLGDLAGIAPDGVHGRAVGWADPVRVRQIIRNLVSNAIRYGGPKRSIEVEQDGSVARIRVRDNGVGVSDETRFSRRSRGAR